jgi:glutamate--cysteine ligase catalytic subunit
VTCLPVMGVGDFTSPSAAPGGPASESEFLPDALINPHPRFAALTRSIRMRRGSKVSIDVPLFKDVATPEYAAPFSADSPPSVHMDAMGFGMGCCCSQVTFQARDCDESRFLYDQLAVLSPIMLALTASTPILRGRLVDTDVRWGVISASVDDRTPAERGVEGGAGGDDSMAGQGSRRLYKSRYASISSYLHFCRRRPDNPMYVLDHYNDIPCPTDPATEERLLKEGLDAALAHHVAHLFVRDPLVIFEGRTSEVSDEDSTDHWENIQSTNWQTVRWKPPPPLPPPEASAGGTPPPLIGWRTEFRSMEVQLTDFENAAYVVFVVLVTRVILAFDLNLYVPLSKVDANMERAHARGSVLGEKFYWRMHMAPPEGDDSHAGGDVEGGESEAQAAGHLAARPCKTNGVAACKDKSKRVACALGYEEMTIQEILLGKGSYYPGLIPLVYAYLDHIGCDSGTFEKVDAYLNLIKCRATGELSTAATFMRNFVQSHPDYKGDSVVSQSISYDLMRLCDDVGKGRCACPDLLGDIVIHPVLPETAYDVPLASSRVSTAQTRELLQKYTSRGAWNERSGVEGPGRPMRPGNGDDLFLDMGLISRTPSLSFY